MTKATGTVDYAKILKGLPVATRRTLFLKLIDGHEDPHQGHVAGIAEQYVAALVEHRSMDELVASRREYMTSPAFAALPEKVREDALEGLGQMAWMLEQRRQGLNSIANELNRLQDAVGEIDGAGTAPAP